LVGQATQVRCGQRHELWLPLLAAGMWDS
jgi:hypothetical protein